MVPSLRLRSQIKKGRQAASLGWLGLPPCPPLISLSLSAECVWGAASSSCTGYHHDVLFHLRPKARKPIFPEIVFSEILSQCEKLSGT